jgi:hypothetical protein
MWSRGFSLSNRGKQQMFHYTKRTQKINRAAHCNCSPEFLSMCAVCLFFQSQKPDEEPVVPESPKHKKPRVLSPEKQSEVKTPDKQSPVITTVLTTAFGMEPNLQNNAAFFLKIVAGSK